MKMKDNPDLWPGIVNALKALWPALGGSAIACAVCYARIIYDGERRKNKWLEGILCGLLAYSVSYSIGGATLFGWVIPKGFDVIIGASIGFIGVDKLREYALRFINKKTGGSDA